MDLVSMIHPGITWLTYVLTVIRGADGVADDARQYQCYMYMRDPNNSKEVDSNHYAFPLSFSPVSLPCPA